MTPLSREQIEQDAMKALACLCIAVEEPVARDVNNKVMAYVNALRQQLAESEQAAYDVAGTITVLKQQLAEMTQERDALQGRLTTELFMNASGQLLLDETKQQLATVTQEKKDLQKHLDYVIEEWNQSDATLRQQLAGMTQERDDLAEGLNLQSFVDVRVEQQCREIGQQLEAQRTATYQAVEREHAVKRALADVTQKRDRLRGICEEATEEVIEYANVSGIPSGRPTEPSLPESIRQLKHHLHQQLAYAQATVTRLENYHRDFRALITRKLSLDRTYLQRDTLWTVAQIITALDEAEHALAHGAVKKE